MPRLIHCYLLGLALACCQKAQPEPPKTEPSDATKAAYVSAEERLTQGFLDRGMVVSKGGDGHKGDSLIWSGVALASLDCAHGSQVVSGLTALLGALGGGLARHWEMLDQVSMDGAVGFYYGVAQRIKHCPGEAPHWAAMMNLHENYLIAHKGEINAQAAVSVPPEFTFPRDLLMAHLQIIPEPDHTRLPVLANEVAGWVEADKLEKKPCYRAHVGWLALATAQSLGLELSTTDRQRFCAAENGMDLPVIDHWCGRGNLLSWVQAFKFNVYEYRHQRCPAWEAPDGDGLETPGVDYLLGLTEEFNL